MLNLISESKSPQAGRTAEEVLLCCSTTKLEPQQAERLRRLLQQPLDWAHLVGNAFFHGVHPLLYASLMKTGADLAAPSLLANLREHYRGNARRNLVLTSELLKLLADFEESHIQAIPFKGPVLAALAYQDIALRAFGDLDICVQRRNIPRAANILVSHGYHCATLEADPLANAHESEHVAFLQANHYVFRHPDGRVVDLQWRVSEQYFAFSLDNDRLWRRLAPVHINNQTVFSFAPTDMLLILCVHGSKHRWEKLKWICDVAELIRACSDDIDWDQLQNHAASRDAERMVALGLSAAHELLQADIPDEILRRLEADAPTRSLLRQVRTSLFAQSGPRRSGLQRLAFYLRAKDRRRHAAQFCFDYARQLIQAIFVPTPLDRKALPLPARLSFVYFLFRPLRLTWRHSRAALENLTRKKLKA